MFGTSAAWLDYDKDGRLDVFVGNYVQWTPATDLYCSLDGTKKSYCTPESYKGTAAKLYHNAGGGRFEDVSAQAGADFARPGVARGAAYADYDRDGDLDLLVTNNHGPARLLRNDVGTRQHWISIRTRGAASNRDGIGAVVRVESASGKQWNTVRSGSSYLSQSDLALTFGLGADSTVRTIEVEWPSGAKDRIANVGADQFVIIEEGKGIVSTHRAR